MCLPDRAGRARGRWRWGSGSPAPGQCLQPRWLGESLASAAAGCCGLSASQVAGQPSAIPRPARRPCAAAPPTPSPTSPQTAPSRARLSCPVALPLLLPAPRLAACPLAAPAAPTGFASQPSTWSSLRSAPPTPHGLSDKAAERPAVVVHTIHPSARCSSAPHRPHRAHAHRRIVYAGRLARNSCCRSRDTFVLFSAPSGESSPLPDFSPVSQDGGGHC